MEDLGAEIKRVDREIAAAVDQAAKANDKDTVAFWRDEVRALRRKEEQLREADLILLRKSATAGASAAGPGSSAAAAGAAAGVGLGSAGAGGLVPDLQGLSIGSAAASGSQALGSRATGGAAAADAAHGSYERLMQAVFPPRVFNLSFQLFNGGHLALLLVFLATGAGISGTVKHISLLQSEFTLVAAAEETMTDYITSFHSRDVRVLRKGEDPPDGPYVVVNACGFTDDQALLKLGWGGKLVSSFVSTKLQLSIEGAGREANREEGASQHSLGRSSSASIR